MNTQLQYAYYQENFEIFQYKHKTYGYGVWYNPEEMSYEEAINVAEDEVLEKLYKDNPHLVPQSIPQAHPVENIGIINKAPGVSPKLINHEIENAETLKDLKSYEFFVNQPQNKYFLAMYNKRLKELSK